MPSVDPAYVAAAAGLGGAVIGAAASVGAMLLQQRSAAKRDDEERHRREERTRAMFVGFMTSLYQVVEAQSRMGRITELGRFQVAYEPLEAASRNPDLLRDLEPKMITAVAEAVADTELSIDTMRRELGPPGAYPKWIDTFAYYMQEAFNSPRESLEKTLRTFGVAEPKLLSYAEQRRSDETKAPASTRSS